MDEGPVYASQIELTKRIWVDPTPLRDSSYAYLLYKAHRPFSACRQSNGPKSAFLLELAIWMRDWPVYTSWIKKHRWKRIVGRTNSLLFIKCGKQIEKVSHSGFDNFTIIILIRHCSDELLFVIYRIELGKYMYLL